MYHLTWASIGLLLLCSLVQSNQYDPYEPLIAEASQQSSQYAAVASFNKVSDARPQYQAVASYSGNNNNNGQISQFASGGKNQYWWENAPDSPFKKSEQTAIYATPTASSPCNAGCTSSSNHINHQQQQAQPQQPLDLSHNPFLNGNYVATLPQKQPIQQAQAQVQQPQQQYYHDQFVQHTPGAPCNHQVVQVATPARYNANPIYPIAQTTAGTNTPIGTNRGVNVASYNQIQGGNGFGSKTQYNSQRESGSQFISATVGTAARTSCSEQGRICAPKSFCQNGLVRSDQLSLLDDSRSECEAGEVCCKIYYDQQQAARPFASASQVRCRSGNQKCVPAYQCVNGELTSEGLKYAARLAPSQTCESPKVCCAEARSFDSVPAAANSNPLTPEGYVISVPDRRYLPSEPEQPDRIGAPDTPNESKLAIPTQPPSAQIVVSTTYLPPTQARPIPTRPSTIRPAQQRVTSRPPISYDEQPANNNPAILSFPAGCPAAMNCTLKEYCTAGAVISKTIVELTPDQELFRVPMTQCKMPRTGEEGFCCRDADYEDPWPKGILGQYRPDLLGFDDGSYKPTNGAASRNGINAAASQIRSQRVRPGTPLRAAASEQNAVVAAKTAPTTCGKRDRTLSPQGPAQVNTNFGEIPWQVMVLRESTKTLICGGAIISPTAAMVTAKCVQGLRTNDILIKTGEWQLGTNVEPKGTTLIRVKSVQAHPQYNPSTLEYDIAILHLFEPIKYDVHVAPICLDEQESVKLDNCIVTGWGKEVLKVHAQDAIMQYTEVYPMSEGQCSQYLPAYNSACSYCGQTKIDACQVDPGSALACQGPNGNYVIKGIYSTESDCGSQNQLVTFTKIDTNWVKSALNPRARQISAAASSHQAVRVKPPTSYLPPN